VSVFAFAQRSTLGRSIVLDALLKKKRPRAPVARWSHGTGQGESLAGRHVDGIVLLGLVKSTWWMADADLRRRQEASKAKEKRRAISKGSLI
jgi:hypothetical protein